jgi:tetratricopeptide (TPR) repeat protein
MPGSDVRNVLRLGVLFAVVGGLFAGLALYGREFPEIAEPATGVVAVGFLVLASLTLLLTARLLWVRRRDRKRESRRAWRERVAELLRETSEYGVLPRLSELPDDAFGILPTRHAEFGDAPYITRERTDQQLADVLSSPDQPHPFVLVVGATKSGKSRTALEAVREVFGGRNPAVVLPKHGPALVDLVRLRPRIPIDPAPAVVWLGDVDGPLLDHLTQEVVQELTSWAVIVGTMSSERCRQIRRAGTDIAVSMVTALNRAARVDLDTEPTEFEITAFRRVYPRVKLPDTGGIGAALAGGPELESTYRSGAKASPAGLAIVRAALDWQRAGMVRPITETELRCLFPLYLRDIDLDVPPAYEQFASGLEWATAPLESAPPLLVREADGWTASNYLAALDDRTNHDASRPIPESVWRELLAIAAPPEAFGLAVAAYLRGEHEASATAFRHVIETGAGGHLLAANVGLGIALAKLDEVAEAAAAFRTVIDSGHPGQLPRAALNLGNLLSKKGDVVGARNAYDQAIESGSTDYAPRAAFSLGLLLAKHDDTAGAQVAFEQAVRSGHPDAGPSAAVGLGGVRHAHGDLVGARAAYEQAIRSGHPDAAPLAEELLAELPESDEASIRAPETWQ